MRFFAAVFYLLACLAGFAHAADPAPAGQTEFITRRGDQLYEGDKRFRFISFNIPNLMVIEDAYEFTKPNPWRWPDEFEIEDALESIRQMGGQVARTYVVSVFRDGSDMGRFVHVLGPGEFNEEGFVAMDHLLAAARRKGIRVIIPFVDQYKWWGGIGEYAAFRGKAADDFWKDRQLIDDFKATVRHVIMRKNTVTGITYRDDPTILGWETGNEILPTPEWTREIAAYIKELDPNHLVLDGQSLRGIAVSSLDDPNIDVITTHHYPFGTDHDFVKPIQEAHALTKGKKAYFVGEFGFVSLPHIAAAIETVIDDEISGALLWSLRMHRREGGFYWHMEVGTGRNIYKAFHWPGFASGDRYDERPIMELVRKKAHEIRQLELPPMEKPAAPKLLPIERVSAISWQGSAGASAYDVWRSPAADGKWEKIAENVSDADVQYRPLFNDATAVPGKEYYYRVSARNATGESGPSNVVGPVKVNCRTLVDECGDLTRVDSSKGVEIATDNARTTLEDSHRLALSRGLSVVYQVSGPISAWQVFSFTRDPQATIEFAISSDGKIYSPVEVERRAFAPADTVYGYLLPELFTGRWHGKDARYLRLSVPATPSTDDQQGSAPFEIGRIEIEFDRTGQPERAGRKKSAFAPAPASATVFVDSPESIDETLRAIDRAAARGDRRLSVAVTILVDLTNDLRIKSYGWSHGPDAQYAACDEQMRARFQEALEKVFARMVEHDMEIFILPHIDAGGAVQTWRNWVDFDPLKEYAGYSYDGLMIGSIADALGNTVKPTTRVEIALSGEMGTSLFLYPESYRKMARLLRAHPDLNDVKIGISLNHSGIAGGGNPTGAPDIELDNPARRQLQSLIDESDFVGMSFYRPISIPPTQDDFVRGIDHFMSEFDAHGLTVPTTKPMHFSEVGIGGGHHDDDDARDPAKAVESPWAGSGTERINPWRTDAMRDLRRAYHRALLAFLAEQPARWEVTAAFFWSTGSWDPQGMRHPLFADPEIVAAIERHNDGVGRKSKE